jgi:hypothetical protein
MRHSLRIAGLLALTLTLAGCETFDLDKFDVFGLNEKKKLPGDRRAVFPDGVPGVPQGVPPEMVRGGQPDAGAAESQASLTEPAPAAPPPAAAPARAKPKPAAKPRTASAPRPARQPAEAEPDAGVWPAPPQQQQQQQQQAQPGAAPWPEQQRAPAPTRWPEPPPTGTFSR